LESFCNGLAIFCGIAVVLATTWVFVAEGWRRKRANLGWAAFCLEKGWEFTPYAVSWHGPAFPSAKGSWRGRQFVMSVWNSLPVVRVVGVKAGPCNFGFMSQSELKKLSRHFSFPYIGSGDGDGRYGVTATSQELAEAILEHGQLRDRMRGLVDQGCSVLGFNDEGLCSAAIDWHRTAPADTQQMLNLLCDLADAAERAADKAPKS
jgi:hypothetical protein